MAIIDDIKLQDGRLNNEIFDSIIDGYIESAKLDLIATGVSKAKVEDESDQLIVSAIKEYVFSFIDEEYGELHRNSYDMQKNQLRHFADYK